MKPSSLLRYCTITAMMKTVHSSLGQRSKMITLGGYDFSTPKADDRHKGTIIAWPSASSILLQKGANVQATRQEIANLVKTIAKFEPVEVFVKRPESSRKADKSAYESASHMLHGIANVTLRQTSNVDSLWARDTGPHFVYATPSVNSTTSAPSPQPVGLVMNFNQWGQKEDPTVDSYFAASACDALDRQTLLAPFIAEGGGIEMDGVGTMIATESAILNANRNPGVDKDTMETYFKKLFGVTKIIWLPGTVGEDITDDHIDALARFGPSGVVFLTKPFVPRGAKEEDILSDYTDAVKLLKDETNAQGKPFTVVESKTCPA